MTMITRKSALFLTFILALIAAPAIQRANTPLTFEERLAKLEAEVSTLRQENQQLRSQIGIAVARSGAVADASGAPSAAADAKADEAEASAKKSAALAGKPLTPAPVAGVNVSAITPPKPQQPAAGASAPLPAIIKPGGSEQWLSVGGFIMAQAEAGDAIDSRVGGTANSNAANDRFYLRRARIVLGGHFAEDFDFKISAEMAGSLTANSGMRGQLADGFISWTKHPAFNATIGQFKTSYGYEFLYNDLTVYPIEHALVTDLLTLGRQIGAQASGTFLKTRLNYTVGMFNGNGANASGINTTVNDNNQFLYAGRISFVPVKTKIAANGWDAIWNIGANGYRSNDNSVTKPDGTTFANGGRRTGWGVDTQLAVGPWVLWFEYLNTEFAPAHSAPGKITADGWYLQGAWNIVPKKWQAVLRYETFDPNTKFADNQTSTWTIGANYLIKGDDLKIMLDYALSDPRFRASDDSYKNEGSAGRVLLRVQSAF